MFCCPEVDNEFDDWTERGGGGHIWRRQISLFGSLFFFVRFFVVFRENGYERQHWTFLCCSILDSFSMRSYDNHELELMSGNVKLMIEMRFFCSFSFLCDMAVRFGLRTDEFEERIKKRKGGIFVAGFFFSRDLSLKTDWNFLLDAF